VASSAEADGSSETRDASTADADVEAGGLSICRGSGRCVGIRGDNFGRRLLRVVERRPPQDGTNPAIERSLGGVPEMSWDFPAN
jgi:hypothetical protein